MSLRVFRFVKPVGTPLPFRHARRQAADPGPRLCVGPPLQQPAEYRICEARGQLPLPRASPDQKGTARAPDRRRGSRPQERPRAAPTSATLHVRRDLGEDRCKSIERPRLAGPCQLALSDASHSDRPPLSIRSGRLVVRERPRLAALQFLTWRRPRHLAERYCRASAGAARAHRATYSGPSKLTSTFSCSTRSSISAEEVSARLSASSSGAEKKLRGHSRRRRTTLISAAKIVSWAPR
jgi:hypothetical protein